MPILPRPTVLFQEVADGGVLFSLTDEVYFGLNGTGATVWRRLADGDAERADLVAALADRYPDAPAGDLDDDVAALLADFEAAGLIEPAAEPARTASAAA